LRAGGERGEGGEESAEKREGRVDVGIMLELSDPKTDSEEQKAKGVGGVWDRAASWPWASIKVFRPTVKK
jgi:hypothetical protein